MIVRVDKGDTLAAIAERYHTNEADIVERNRLENMQVHVGMRLWVVGYLWHVWMPDDTLPKVCARYAVNEQDVRRVNGQFSIGKRIKIPV